MSSSSRISECGVRLDADLDFVLPDLRPVVGHTSPLPEQALWSTYVDTPDLRLWARGITLRHRTGEGTGDGTWTLELPGGDRGGRGGPVRDGLIGRSELTWPGVVGAVPADALRIVHGIVRRRPLEPIVEIESRRRRLRLGDGGTVLGEIDDDTLTVHGGARDGLRFREIELELAAPGDDAVDDVLAELHGAGARAGRRVPKLGRALAGVAPGARRPTRPGHHSSVADVVAAAIDGALGGILDHDYRLRLDPERPPAPDVHKLRVATRRLRSDLRTLRGGLDPVWVAHTRGDLRWLGTVLGSVRDADVLERYLERARQHGLADGEGVALLVSATRRERIRAGRQLVEVLDSDRYLDLMDRLHAATTAPPLFVDSRSTHGIDGAAPADVVLAGLLARARRSLAKEVRRARYDPSDHRLHRVRIRAKELRYASELAGPVLGRPARRTATSARRLQDALGEHQDAVVADAWLRAQLGTGPSVLDFAAGQLSVDQARRRHRARQRWSADWNQVRRRARRL